MTGVTREFLGQLTDDSKWQRETRIRFLDFVQDCGDGIVGDIRTMVRGKMLLQCPDEILPARRELQAQLLKCLISCGGLRDEKFWLDQFGVLGPEYGAVIFSGLTDCSLEVAMKHLPILCINDEAFGFCRWLFPQLVHDHGPRVREILESMGDKLPPDRYAVLLSDCEPVK